MKIVRLTAVVLTFLVFGSLAANACNGPTRTKTAPNGKIVTICLDGTKATCIRDGMRQGHSREAATAFCSGRGLK